MERDTRDGETAFYPDAGNNINQQGSSRQRFNFNREDFPRPWLSGGPQLWDILAKRHENDVKVLEELIGRPLTFSENESIAYWTAKEVQVRSRGAPLGFMFGIYRAYATSKEFRFPFYKPTESFNPNVVRVLGTTFLQGVRARIFWHAARYFAYGMVVGPVLGATLTMSWGVSVGNAGRIQDPRTKGLFESIRKIAQERQRMIMSNRNQGQALKSPPDANYDTNSPTSEYGQEFSTDNGSQVNSSQGSASFTNYDTSPIPSAAATSYIPTSTGDRHSLQGSTNETSGYDQPNENKSSGFFEDTYDDASPTAPYPSSSSSSSSSGGSAWDRIRAGKDANTGSQPRSWRANDTTQTDSSMSTKADSRSQAQKEFDASLERERQGRNFD